MRGTFRPDAALVPLMPPEMRAAFEEQHQPERNPTISSATALHQAPRHTTPVAAAAACAAPSNPKGSNNMNDVTTAGVQLNAQTATEYDFIIALDASGSMGNPSTRFSGKTRWQEGQELIIGLAGVLAGFDADGIDVITFGQSVQVFESTTADKVSEVLSTVSPYGGTPTDKALAAIVAKQKASGKNTVAIIFTDGEPNDKAAVEKVIVDAANSIEKDEALTFLFVQIGNAPDATAFLQHLDDELQSKGAAFDIVDTLAAEVAETMAPLDLINHAIND
jgi:Mg-chelatase subunit ChlD